MFCLPWGRWRGIWSLSQLFYYWRATKRWQLCWPPEIWKLAWKRDVNSYIYLKRVTTPVTCLSARNTSCPAGGASVFPVEPSADGVSPAETAASNKQEWQHWDRLRAMIYLSSTICEYGFHLFHSLSSWTSFFSACIFCCLCLMVFSWFSMLTRLLAC